MAFNAITIALYNIIPKNIFIIAAGITTILIKLTKEPGKPTNRLADPKNTNPLNIVPKLKAIIIFILLLILFPINLNIKYIAFAVTTLSIILGSCPPGNFVVSAVSSQHNYQLL